MTTASRTHRDAGRPVTAELARADTAGLPSGHPFLVETLSLLDHRVREHLLDAADAPPGRYLAVDGPEGELFFPLTRPIVHVGRGLVADIRLEDPHVSRRHAIIALRGEGVGGVRVLDDRSANGTWVNGQEVSVVPLADGDVLRFGRAVFRYVERVPRPTGVRARRASHVAELHRPTGGWGPTPRPRHPSTV